jgi:LDH2 family malate/lactate/ureidoglycolate dehydrogenase
LQVRTVLGRVKGAARKPGVDAMQLPGERGNALAAKRVAENRIPVERNLLAGLEKLAASYSGAAGTSPSLDPTRSLGVLLSSTLT